MSDSGTIELSSEIPGLIEAVVAYLKSATYADKAVLIERHPDLLTDEADNVLRQIEDLHRGAGDLDAARGMDGTRFTLRRIRSHGIDNAVLEQAVLAAFIGLPDTGGAGGYMATIGERYPELLRPQADRAMETLAEVFDDEVMGSFLAALKEVVQAQRERNAALQHGNSVPAPLLAAQDARPAAQSQRSAALAEDDIGAIDVSRFKASPERVRGVLAKLARCQSVEDLQNLYQTEELARNPAFAEQLCLTSRPRIRGKVRVLWFAIENFISRSAPFLLAGRDKAFHKALAAKDLDRAITLGAALIADRGFSKGSEYFRLEVLLRTAEALLQRHQRSLGLEDLHRANGFFSEACSLARTGSPSFTRAATYGGLTSLMKFQRTSDPGDLETAILVLRHAVANHEDQMVSLLPQSGFGLARANLFRFDGGQDPAGLTHAAEAFVYTMQASGEAFDKEAMAEGRTLFFMLSERLKAGGDLRALEQVTEAAERGLDAAH